MSSGCDLESLRDPDRQPLTLEELARRQKVGGAGRGGAGRGLRQGVYSVFSSLQIKKKTKKKV